MSLHKIKNIANHALIFNSIINRHNIYQFSASLSYYAALALAPFLLILLKIGSLLGRDTQVEIIYQAQFIMGPDVAQIMDLIFKNINKEQNLASLSGLIGIATLLLTSSVVILQLRYSLDVINGDYDPELEKTFKAHVVERLRLMIAVIATAALFFLSIFISNIIKHFAGGIIEYHLIGQIFLILLNLIINIGLFSAVYRFVPTKKPKLIHAFKMSIFTSFFFLIGKTFISYYLENVASHSVYGAAASLLIFLIWAYYSSFIIFISAELFLFLESQKSKPHQ